MKTTWTASYYHAEDCEQCRIAGERAITDATVTGSRQATVIFDGAPGGIHSATAYRVVSTVRVLVEVFVDPAAYAAEYHLTADEATMEHVELDLTQGIRELLTEHPPWTAFVRRADVTAKEVE